MREIPSQQGEAIHQPMNGPMSYSIASSEIVYFFCGAVGGCSLVGGTMFLSRM
jgi:hypothetical protein